MAQNGSRGCVDELRAEVQCGSESTEVKLFMEADACVNGLKRSFTAMARRIHDLEVALGSTHPIQTAPFDAEADIHNLLENVAGVLLASKQTRSSLGEMTQDMQKKDALIEDLQAIARHSARTDTLYQASISELGTAQRQLADLKSSVTAHESRYGTLISRNEALRSELSLEIDGKKQAETKVVELEVSLQGSRQLCDSLQEKLKACETSKDAGASRMKDLEVAEMAASLDLQRMRADFDALQRAPRGDLDDLRRAAQDAVIPELAAAKVAADVARARLSQALMEHKSAIEAVKRDARVEAEEKAARQTADLVKKHMQARDIMLQAQSATLLALQSAETEVAETNQKLVCAEGALSLLRFESEQSETRKKLQLVPSRDLGRESSAAPDNGTTTRGYSAGCADQGLQHAASEKKYPNSSPGHHELITASMGFWEDDEPSSLAGPSFALALTKLAALESTATKALSRLHAQEK